MRGAFQLNDIRAVCSMSGVALLTGWALWLGFDGILFMSAIAVISGLGGYILMKEGQAMLPDLREILRIIDQKRKEGLL